MNAFEKPYNGGRTMFHGDSHDPIERRLRARWRSERSDPSGPCPDPIVLAAFLDGTLPASERSAVEEHLAACGGCFAAVLDARAMRSAEGDPLPFVPSGVIASAKALLVPAAASFTAHRDRLHRTWWIARAGWGVAAAAVLGVSLFGYHVGTASVRPVRSESDLPAAMTFGLFDGSSGGDLALDLMTMEGES